MFVDDAFDDAATIRNLLVTVEANQDQRPSNLLTVLEEINFGFFDGFDGIIGLGHILAASGVGAEIELTQLPLSTTTQRLLRPDLCLRAALGGGDDYELCFTAAASELAELQSRGEALGVRVTAVGTIQSEPGLRYCRGGERVDLVATGYRHF